MKHFVVLIALALVACSPNTDDEQATQDDQAAANNSEAEAEHKTHGDQHADEHAASDNHDDHQGHDDHAAMNGHEGMDHGSLPAGEVPETSIYNLKTEWTTEDQTSAQLEDFSGSPVVLLMFYATCQSACPVLISDVMQIEDKLSEEAREETEFVLVTFDPETDSVEKLKQLESSYEMDEERYTFLHGTTSEVRELAAVLGVQYRERSSGHFTHTNLITLLDREGNVDTRVEGLRQPGDDIVTSIEEMMQDSD
jgi:protein SCO1/2